MVKVDLIQQTSVEYRKTQLSQVKPKLVESSKKTKMKSETS